MQGQAHIELVTGGYTLERTVELAEKIGWYADGGSECLMKQLNKNMQNLRQSASGFLHNKK